MQPAQFREQLASVPPTDRDAWLDALLGIRDIPDDTSDLPRECVPYLPCPIGRLVRAIDQLGVRESDIFVDVGSGVGRSAAAVHLLTGARVIGLEIQSSLAEMSRQLGTRVPFSTIQTDATETPLPDGSIFFLYCPFSGERLARFLANLERLASTRALRVCCLDLPLPPRPWLEAEEPRDVDIAIYRST